MADSAQPNVRKFLDLTTRHLPEDVLNDLNGFNGVIAHPTPYGAWLWVPDDPQTYADDDADSYRAGSEAGDDQDDDGSAAEILMVQLHARSLGLRLGPVRRRRRCRRRPAYLGLVTTALPCGGPTPQYHAPALPLSRTPFLAALRYSSASGRPLTAHRCEVDRGEPDQRRRAPREEKFP